MMADCAWARGDTACSISLVCQRCGKCLLHCTCPPPELRSPDPEKTGRALVKLFTSRRVRGPKVRG